MMRPRYPRAGKPLFDEALFRRVLTSVRQERGQTYRQAAEQSGVSSATIARIETGDGAKAPDVESYLRLCAYLGCSADDFSAASGANGTPAK